MNGWPEYGMPIRIEIMRSLVVSLQTPACWKRLCGYKTESKEQLCPLDFVVLLFFFSSERHQLSVLRPVSLCDGLWLSVPMSWLRAQLYSPLKCSSSILLMMGRVVMSWCKISGCIQWHGILRTRRSGVRWQFYASLSLRKCRPISIFLTREHLQYGFHYYGTYFMQ